MRLLRWLTRVYSTADPRSLGAGRIFLALLLLADLMRRVSAMGTWYTNDGLLPNHTVLWRPPFEPTFSFFFMASWPSEVACGFVVCGLAYMMLLFGVRTRLAHALSWLCLLSLHGRVLFIQNGGDIVLVELCTWSMFLPLGRRYSWDSLRARLRARQERTSDDLGRRADFAPDTAPIVSLAVFALTAQLAAICAFNALQKTGPTWRAGSAVHYVLHSDGIVTALGLWVRTRLTPPESRLLTWTAWLIEAALPFALLFPFRQRATRYLGMAMVVILHGGLALLLNLGMFAPAMMGFLPFLVPTADWDALGRWWARRPAKRIVIFDGDCGVCFQIVRALARLDGGERLRFISSQSVIEERELCPDLELDADHLAQTIAVVDPVTKQQWVRATAFAQIASMLPFMGLVAWPLRIPGFRRLADAAYDAFAARRTNISIALGLAACGTSNPATTRAAQAGTPARTPGAPRIDEHTQPEPHREEHDLSQGWRSVQQPWKPRPALLREVLVGFLIVLTTVQLLIDNPRLTHVDRSWQPRWMAATTIYLQFMQSWAMFAPDAPLTDTNLSVDAMTVDGRHVDPLNEVASAHQPRPGLRIPPRLGQNALFSAYMRRLPWNEAYFGALTEWILGYPKRTGRAADEIVAFDVYYVEDDSPAPGEREPRNTRTTRIVRYPP